MKIGYRPGWSADARPKLDCLHKYWQWAKDALGNERRRVRDSKRPHYGPLIPPSCDCCQGAIALMDPVHSADGRLHDIERTTEKTMKFPSHTSI